MKEAGIEPTVFYKRYKNLEDFYSEFVKRYDYWFSEVIKNAMTGEDMMDDVYNMLSSLLTELSGKSIMLELLRWEVAQGNDITNKTSKLREEHTLPLAGKYLSHYFGTDVDIVAWSSLLISGIYYLCLHKDMSEFCGIDINNPEHVESQTCFKGYRGTTPLADGKTIREAAHRRKLTKIWCKRRHNTEKHRLIESTLRLLQ